MNQGIEAIVHRHISFQVVAIFHFYFQAIGWERDIIYGHNAIELFNDLRAVVKTAVIHQ